MSIRIDLPVVGPACQKCGGRAGWTGPTFESDYGWSRALQPGIAQALEWITFRCNTCGWRRRERPLDYPVSAPPPPPSPDRDPNQRVHDSSLYELFAKLWRVLRGPRSC